MEKKKIFVTVSELFFHSKFFIYCDIFYLLFIKNIQLQFESIRRLLNLLNLNDNDEYVDEFYSSWTWRW